jgi:hypothetical protein
MCNQCNEIDVKIKHLQVMASRMLDQQTLDGIVKSIRELEAKKAALHPK